MIIIEAYQDFLNSIPENYTNEIDMNVINIFKIITHKFKQKLI